MVHSVQLFFENFNAMLCVSDLHKLPGLERREIDGTATPRTASFIFEEAASSREAFVLYEATAVQTKQNFSAGEGLLKDYGSSYVFTLAT